jgi:hypothetical protein
MSRGWSSPTALVRAVVNCDGRTKWSPADRIVVMSRLSDLGGSGNPRQHITVDVGFITSSV